MECEYCNTILKSLSSLKYHKKTNKKCLEKQNIDSTDEFIPCKFCDKIFTSRILKTHIKTCKNKKVKEKDDIIEELLKEKDLFEELLKEKDEMFEIAIKEKDDIIEEMKNRILKLETENDIYKNDHDFVKNLASQPKITTNNNNNKIRVMNNFFDNPEKVKQLVDEKLTQNHICDGQKGVAQFAYDILLKDDDGNINYFCTDPSRSIFKFQNADGETEKDIKALKLTNMLLDAGIKHKTGTIAPTLWTKKDGTVDADKFQIFSPSTNEIILMQSDNSVFRNELACLTSV
jgi:Rps23 Pro-64 3,4-dihydroxylase Tpa1-like proline 4-hydroxylase